MASHIVKEMSVTLY